MLLIVQHVADLQFGKQFIGQGAFIAIEGCALWHKEHGKGAAGASRHIWPSRVSYHSTDEYSCSRFHLRGYGVNLHPLWILAEQFANSHLSQVSANLKLTRLMGARQKIQAAILNSCVIQCYPQHDGLMRVKRVVGVIHVEVGWIGPRLLDQRVVVIQSNPLYSGQICRESTQLGIENQLFNPLTGLPEIDALNEDVLVVIVFSSLMVICTITAHTLCNRFINGLAPRS